MTTREPMPREIALSLLVLGGVYVYVMVMVNTEPARRYLGET